MSRLEKIKFLKETSHDWKIMFELYDYIRWTSTVGRIEYAEYNSFMQVCGDELYRIKVKPDNVPVKTNSENHNSRWEYLKTKFECVEHLKYLLDHDVYVIGSYQNKIYVRSKGGTTNSKRIINS